MFPNKSRSYDEVARLVRFTGYDGMFEIRIGVQINALPLKSEDASTEADCLAAFDANRSAIQEAACRAYSRHRANVLLLTLADLKA